MKKLIFVLIPLLAAFPWLSGCNRPGVLQIDQKYIDTNILVYKDGMPLNFYQYAPFINTGEYDILMVDKKRVLSKRSTEALKKNNKATREAITRFNLSKLERKSVTIPIWDRALVKNIPADIDTNIIIYDQDHVALKFYQYFGILFNTMGELGVEKGERYLWRYSELFNLKNPVHIPADPRSGEKALYVYSQLLLADKILVIKNERKVYLQRQGKAFLTMPCNLGSNPVGDKEQEGDRRTPEGNYYLVGYNWDGKYGKQYLISYPDSAHLAAAKSKGVLPGGEVMLHGTSAARSNLKDWTNGCIALSNAHMDSLFKYVIPGTSIEIRK
jgi:hypothetical protein